MLSIHTAAYLHADSHFPFCYLTRANLILSEWCRSVDVELISETFSLTKWNKLSPWPYSFEFGTLVKFASIKGFLDSKSRGDRYIWFDSDIYPTKKAYSWSPESLPINGFWGWRRIEFESLKDEHRHQYSKIAWANAEKEKEWFSVGSGIFSLSRKDLGDFWDFVNADASIDSPEWWELLYSRQVETNERVLAAGSKYSEAWMYGLDEHWIEEWVNRSGVQWEQIPDSVHSVPRIDPNAILLHYDGKEGKLNFPSIATPNQTVAF